MTPTEEHHIYERLATIEANQNHQNDTLDKILAQVQKTNGRVTNLEFYKEQIKGKISVISAVVSIIVTTIAAAIARNFNL